MPVTPADVRRLAEVAGIHLAPADEARLTQRLEELLQQCEALDEIDADGVEPLIQPFAEPVTLRDDAARPGLSVEEALANAPERHGPLFKVPRMIEEAGDDGRAAD